MNRLAKHAAALALWMIPGAVLALGLGEIHVNSRLNEALDAEIELLYSDVEEAQSTQVNLASAEDFRRVGLDAAAIPVPLRFAIEQDSAGRYLVRVRSSQPVGDPFLDFLIEVNWPNGRLLREYVVLLDPPVTAPAEVAPLAAAPPAARPTPAPSQTPAPRREQPRPAFDDDGTYEVVRGDTLWEIARDHRPAGDVTINQMMMVLYRMNPEAFFRDNINALKAGAVLRLPELDDLRELPVTTALAQVRTQNQAWESYRQSWAGRTPTVSDAGVSPEYVRPQPGAPETDDSRLELVPPADRADASELASLRADLARSREELVSAGQENVELQSRVGELENLISNLERAITLKDADLADLQNQIELAGVETPAQPPVADPGLEPVTPVDAGSTEDTALSNQGFESTPDAATAAPGEDAETPTTGAVTEPVDATADAGVTPAPPRRPEPGLVDKVRGAVNNPLVLGGLGAALLLGLGGWLWSRRRGEPETGGTLVDRMVAANEMADAPPFADDEEADRVDATVDGEDEAALIAAIEEEPGDPQTHLALLRRYYASDQADQFAAAAQRMLSNIGGESHPAWMEVKAMGANLAPNHPLFAPAEPAAEDAGGDQDFEFDTGDRDDEIEAAVGPPPEFDADAVDQDQPEAEDDLSLDFELEEGDLPDLDARAEQPEAFAAADDDDLSLDFDLGPGDLPASGGGEGEDELTLAGADVPDAGDDLLELDSDLDTPPADTLEELEIADLDLGEEAVAEKVSEAAPADEADTEFELQALSADGEGDTELDLDLNLDSSEESATEEEAVDPEQVRKQSATLAELEASDEDLGLDDLNLDEKAFGDDDAVGTKLDLAKAYIDMGDPEGARGMLEEVMAEGNPGQKEEAEDLLGRLTP